MTKQDIIKKIELKCAEWFDLTFITETIAIGKCLCDKSHNMLYSNKTNTFTCLSCGFSNLSLFELTKQLMKKDLSKDEVIVRILKKYFKNEDKMINVILEESSKHIQQSSDYEQMNKDAHKFFKEQLISNKEALAYLKKRGFSKEDIVKYKIGYAPKYNMLYKHLKEKYTETNLELIGLIGLSEKTGHYYDVFRDRIVFPIYDKHKILVGFSGRVFNDDAANKYLNTKVTPLFIKNELLYNLYNIINEKHSSIYVCEGFMDVISLRKIGIENVVCTMGTAFSKKHLQELQKITDKIIMLYDGDDAGIKAANKTMNNLKSDISILILPDGLDPDEYLNKYGKDKFIEYASSKTQSWVDWKIQQIKTNI